MGRFRIVYCDDLFHPTELSVREREERVITSEREAAPCLPTRRAPPFWIVSTLRCAVPRRCA